MRQSLFQLGTSIVGSRLSKKTVQIWANIPSDAVQTLTSNLLFAGGKSPMLNDLGNGWHEFMASISSDLEQDASAQLLALGADDIDVVPLSKSMRVATMREYFGPALLKLLPEPR